MYMTPKAIQRALLQTYISLITYKKLVNSESIIHYIDREPCHR